MHTFHIIATLLCHKTALICKVAMLIQITFVMMMGKLTNRIYTPPPIAGSHGH